MKESYWSLVIESKFLQSGIWSIDADQVNVSCVSKIKEWADHELVEVADAVLSESIKDFHHETEPSKTVFGVSPHWVENGQIKKEHLEKIRKLCVDLSLSPSGFVVIPEAIAHTIKVEESSPLSGLVIGVGEKMIDVSLFKFGNLVGTVNVGKSVSIIDDIVEGLVRFASKDALPTRIILYGGDFKELDEVKQGLIKTDWEDKANGKVKFLHIPQIEITSPSQKMIAVACAGASEITEINTVKFDGQVIESKNTDNQQELVNEIDEETNVSPTHDLTPSDLGFVIDEDISEVGEEEEEPQFAQADIRPVAEKKPKFVNPFSKIKLPKKEDTGHLGNLKFGRPGVSTAKKIIFVGILLTGLSVLGVFAAWWYIPKAEIAVFVSPKNLEDQETITLDENRQDSDPSNLTFPIKRMTVEVSADKSKQTTGTRVVGEKATGSVTIRNGTAQGINFPSGTTLTGPNSLKFTLSDSASVSAALSPSEPGSVTVAVVASDIGSDYNLASDESLSVGNYPKSEVDAVVSGGLSGGNSKEIVAVSQTDLNVLKEELLEELERQGLSELESQASDTRFIPDSVDSAIVTSKFSNAVGDEASTISLNMTVEVTGLGVVNAIVDSLAETVLGDQIPQGFAMRREQVDIIFNLNDEIEDGVYEFDIDLTANLLPEINIEEIKKSVAGKAPVEAQKYLQTIPGFASAEVILQPRFPSILGIIPYIKDNISVEIVAER